MQSLYKGFSLYPFGGTPNICTRGRAAVSRVPACGHVAVTYAAHVARQRGLAMRSPFAREDALSQLIVTRRVW